jgi:colanic acid/amylovoran biosynthesis glycosyltransferase
VKIGLFHSSLPAYSETFILSKIRGLIQEGHDVRMYLANASSQPTDFPYVNPYPRRGLLFMLVAPWVMIFLFLTRSSVVLKLWKKEKADNKTFSACLKSIYVNAHILQAKKLDWLHFTFSTFALGRENVASAIGAKMAVSFRGFDVGIYPLKHPGCFARLWQVVDKVHTISDDLYALALENGLLSSIPMQKIRPAILYNKLKVKENSGFIKAECAIVSIGRLEWKKGFTQALLAMQMLKENGIRFSYKIVGEGTMKEELRFAIDDLGLKDCVHLVGKLPHEEVFNFLNDADLYIQPSVQEGFCNALLEAQGTGLLCIASDAEGLSENIMDGETGWIVPKRDQLALASKIEEVIGMGIEKRKLVALRAVARIREEFKIDRLVNEFKSFYNLN